MLESWRHSGKVLTNHIHTGTVLHLDLTEDGMQRTPHCYIDIVKLTMLKLDEFIRRALSSPPFAECRFQEYKEMFSWSKNEDRVAIVQMNADLRNAQLELLSAECATDRLRLRFSTEDVAHYGQRDVLRKAMASATAIHDYYSQIAQQVSDSNSVTPQRAPSLEEEKVVAAIDHVCRYLQDQRREYRPQGVPLSKDQKVTMKPFFPLDLLAGIRIVEMRNQPVPNPPFYAEAKALGLTNLPELAHMASLTFEDVVVFPSEITDRRLFHALVHAVQFKVLGLERYTELFVRSFLRTRAHVSVPLEMHAFSLESRFAEKPDEPFLVEEKVRLWINQGRY